MVVVVWTENALYDLKRLAKFLAETNPQAAFFIVDHLEESTDKLIEYPRMGEMLTDFMPEEIRRLILDNYELRYAVEKETVTILRISHTREDR